MYNGSFTMMAKPNRALELHYPMIQFLIMSLTCTGYRIFQTRRMRFYLSHTSNISCLPNIDILLNLEWISHFPNMENS